MVIEVYNFVSNYSVFDVSGIVTRSKKASSGQRWTQTPLPVKLLKVLIEELRTQIENIAEDNVGDDEVSEIVV